MKQFLFDIDFDKNELRNFQVHNDLTAPPGPVKGQMYFNTTDSVLYWHDGTTWVAAKATASVPMGSTSTALVVGGPIVGGVSTSASRADHIHSLPDWGASTATTSFGLAKANGTAGTFARSDHTHGTPVHDNAAHATIPLNVLASPTAALNLNNQKVYNLGAPTVTTDAATKAYVDTAVTSVSIVAGAGLTQAGTTFDVGAGPGISVATDSISILFGGTGSGTSAARNDHHHDTTYLKLAGGTMTGTLVLPASDPVGVNDAARKSYVDTQVATRLTPAAADAAYINVGGDTMTGALVLPAANPTINTHATHKLYVDTEVAKKLDQAAADVRYINTVGDTMTGTLTLAGDPPGPNDAARKGYVDGAIANQAVADQLLYVNTAGDTMTGVLTLIAANPLTDNTAAHKKYVDAQVATKLDQVTADTRYINVLGDTMTGPLALPTPSPVGAYDAAHKTYVDTTVANRPILWSQVQLKPDPTVTVNLTGPVTAQATATLTDLETNITLNLAGVLGLNQVTLGTQTVGNYVAAITGSNPKQISISNPTAGEGTAHALTLPQDIDSLATPTFASMTLKTLALTIPTGTAPLSVASTTRVSNLNSDLLDGKHATDFADLEMVETLMGDLWFQGLYDPNTWLLDPLNIPKPVSIPMYRHGMYWIAGASASVGFIDSDYSGRYDPDTDEPVYVANGDWLIATDPDINTHGVGYDLTAAQIIWQWISFSSETFVKSQIEEHANDPYDPHQKAGYITQLQGNAWWLPIGTELLDAADIQLAIDTHKLEANPHDVYLTKPEGDEFYALTTHLHEGVYEPAGTVELHEHAVDPHTQYTTMAENTAVFALEGHLHDGRYPLLDHTHPTYQYVVSTDVEAGAPAHVYIGSKDPRSLNPADVPQPVPGDIWFETFDIVPQPPAAASSFSATPLSGTQVRLTWALWPNSANVTRIEIQRSPDPPFTDPSGTPTTWAQVYSTQVPSTTTWTDTGLLENTTYHYRIRAVNVTGTGPWKV